MSSAHDICRGQKRLRLLVEFATREGWTVNRTAGGHLKFEKPGLPAIFTRFTTSDRRASENTWAWLRRFARNGAGRHHG